MKSAIFHSSRHLTSSEMIDNRDICPICLSNQKRKEVFQNQKTPDIFFLECTNCFGYSASFMPTEVVLEDYYNSYYQPADEEKKAGESQEAITFHGANRLSKHIANYITNFQDRKSVTIMDFGGGDGTISFLLAKELKERIPNCSFLITVVDYYEKESFRDGDISMEFKKNTDSIKDNNYDIIIASAILEHIPELNKTINTLVAKLNKKGFFYARTPYMIPFSRLKIPVDISYPGHVHDLGHKFWFNFAKTFNLDWSIVLSQTSIVETEFKHQFIRTLLAYLFKMPSRIETFLLGRKKEKKIWNLVGSWEVIFVNNI